MKLRTRHTLNGFSFIEALFALFLVAMVMGALAQTLKQAAGVKTNTASMDQAIEEFHALMIVKNELTSAISVASPSGGASSTRLELRRVNPELTLAARTDELSGDPLNPYEPSKQITVIYELEGGRLVRRTVTPDGHTKTERLLRCKSFEVRLANSLPSIMTVTLEIEGLRVTKSRTIKVAVRGL